MDGFDPSATWCRSSPVRVDFAVPQTVPAAAARMVAVGELQVTLADGGVDVFVDEVVGEEPGNPYDGARVSHFLFDRSRVEDDRFVVLVTQVDVDLWRRCPAVVVGCVQVADYRGDEWRSARWVGTGPDDGVAELIGWVNPRWVPRPEAPPRPRAETGPISLPAGRQLVAGR